MIKFLTRLNLSNLISSLLSVIFLKFQRLLTLSSHNLFSRILLPVIKPYYNARSNRFKIEYYQYRSCASDLSHSDLSIYFWSLQSDKTYTWSISGKFVFLVEWSISGKFVSLVDIRLQQESGPLWPFPDLPQQYSSFFHHL